MGFVEVELEVKVVEVLSMEWVWAVEAGSASELPREGLGGLEYY